MHVHIDKDGTIWDASLNLSNVSGNNNKVASRVNLYDHYSLCIKFYILQVLADNKKKNAFYAHTRWGRVGEDGQVKTVKESSLDDAKKEFEKKFKDKSGLDWTDRNATPKDKKYTYIEKSYEDDEDEDDTEMDDNQDDSKSKVKSKLDLPTQKLMELIFK